MAKHKDVAFEVGGTEHRTLKDAVAAALPVMLERGNAQVTVIVKSKSGAKWYAGQDCVERYNRILKTGDAVVVDRYELRRLGPSGN